MSHFVEVPDPAQPGQAKRPGVGLVLTLRDTFTQTVVGTAATQALGYWGAVLTVPAIDVSADGGTSWVGPLWSAEAQQTGWTAGPYAATAAASATSAAAAAAQARDLALAAQTAAADALSAAQNIEANQDAPTEAVVNNILTDPASTARGSLDTHFDTRYDTRYGAMFERKISTNAADYLTLQAALDATPPGGVCHLPPGEYTIGQALDWPHDVEIRGGGLVTINLTGNHYGLKLRVGHRKPRISGVRIVGTLTPGTQATQQVQTAISGMDSTLANPIVGLHVTDCTFENLQYGGIRAKHVQKFFISKNTFDTFGYLGGGLSSALGGIVSKNRFLNHNLYPAYDNNAYGFFVNFFEPDGLSLSPPSADVLFEGNFVYRQAWEGIDGHTAHRCSAIGNTFVDCEGAAIAFVGSGEQWPTACQDINIANNVIYGSANRTSGTGIILRGSTTASFGVVRVRGTVTGNTIWRTGRTTGAVVRPGGINIAEGLGVVVAGNTIHEPKRYGVIVQDVIGAVLSGNTVVDPWMDSGTSSTMVEVTTLSTPADQLSVTLTGNTLVRAALVLGQDGIPATGSIANAGYIAPAGVTVYQSGNSYPLGTVFSGSTVTHVDTTVRGIRRVWGTAPPTTGQWFRNDEIINGTRSAGGWMGWVCVEAGTPGTWRSYGAISA